jgi:NADH-quinone oxidoreductase subunit E
MAQETVPKLEAATVSEEEIAGLLDELAVSPDSNLIALLQTVQDRLGWLPPGALKEISRRTRIPLSRVYGVVSFYAQFYTEPRGRHTIRVCRGTACHVKGAPRVVDAIRQELGIDEGESTPDLKFYLETVACLGTCFLAPAMMIDNQYFGQLTPQSVKTVLASYSDEGA